MNYPKSSIEVIGLWQHDFHLRSVELAQLSCFPPCVGLRSAKQSDNTWNLPLIPQMVSFTVPSALSWTLIVTERDGNRSLQAQKQTSDASATMLTPRTTTTRILVSEQC
jgi:hypothetical protein